MCIRDRLCVSLFCNGYFIKYCNGEICFSNNRVATGTQFIVLVFNLEEEAIVIDLKIWMDHFNRGMGRMAWRTGVGNLLSIPNFPISIIVGAKLCVTKMTSQRKTSHVLSFSFTFCGVSVGVVSQFLPGLKLFTNFIPLLTTAPGIPGFSTYQICPISP